MDAYKYVIIGGGIAGGKAIEGIRKVDAEGSLVLITNEHERPYERPPLSKAYLAGKQPLDLAYLQPAEFYPANHVEIRMSTWVTRIEPQTRTITLGDDSQLQYEKLLLATGGWPRRLPLPGNDLAGVWVLRGIWDCNGIKAAAAQTKRALVLGGSFIGSEVAASLTQLGVQVTIAFPGPRLLHNIIPESVSAFLKAKFESQDIRLLPGTTATRLEGAGKVERAVMSNGETLDVGLVVMGVGISLSTELAKDAGLELWEKDSVVVDQFLCTSDPNIYAAGDIAAWPDPTFGRRLRVEHWDVARRQGTRAGRNMAGEHKPYTAIPYFFSDMFDVNIEAWGEFSHWDAIVERGDVSAGTFAVWYFDGGKLSGVFTAGRPDDVADIEPLVRQRLSYTDIADKLKDTSFNLDHLLPTAK